MNKRNNKTTKNLFNGNKKRINLWEIEIKKVSKMNKIKIMNKMNKVNHN